MSSRLVLGQDISAVVSKRGAQMWFGYSCNPQSFASLSFTNTNISTSAMKSLSLLVL